MTKKEFDNRYKQLREFTGKVKLKLEVDFPDGSQKEFEINDISVDYFWIQSLEGTVFFYQDNIWQHENLIDLFEISRFLKKEYEKALESFDNDVQKYNESAEDQWEYK